MAQECSLSQYETIMAAMVKAGRLQQNGDLYFCRTTEDRATAFKRLWQHEHPDYRGRLGDVTLSVMGCAKYHEGGCCLVTAATIGDDELAERLASTDKPQSPEAV